jgi:hypothetical protein
MEEARKRWKEVGGGCHALRGGATKRGEVVGRERRRRR